MLITGAAHPPCPFSHCLTVAKSPGIGFAVPSDTVTSIAGQLISPGRVTQPAGPHRNGDPGRLVELTV
jgi:S1-C subfamily serine protease